MKGTMTMTYSSKTLLEMLTYRRAVGSKTIRAFESKFLKPVFGNNPDRAGNYSLRIGDSPRVMFSAHYDSVHRQGGMQRLAQNSKGHVTIALDEKQSNCLGADCATGIWLMLGMIEAGIPGLYVIHAEEETGCIGSRWIVDKTPELVAGIDACIAFDRRGTGSVITFQSGYRTASDKFANALGAAIGLGMKADNSGSYTDSNEYADLIPECTNISVGYYGAHTKAESQDIGFAESLLSALLTVDWSSLPITRRAGDTESLYRCRSYTFGGASFKGGNADRFRDPWNNDDWNYYPSGKTSRADNSDSDLTGYSMERLCEDYPEEVASILADLGYDRTSLAHAIADLAFTYGGKN